MADWVWVAREDGWGEVAVDLHQCRRFRVWQLDEYGEGVTAYFLMNDNRWIEQGQFIERDEDGERHGYYYSFVNEFVVARTIFLRRRQLPPELTTLLEIVSNDDRFNEWKRSKTGQGGANASPMAGGIEYLPRWAKDDRTLYYRGEVVHKFVRDGKGQSLLMEMFEKRRWTQEIRIAKSDQSKIQSAVKYFKKVAPNSPVQFGYQKPSVYWYPRESDAFAHLA